jgi:zinc protease
MRLLTTFLSIWLLLILAIALPAQEALQKPLPLDPAVRTGTLDNGLSYYLRHNAKPENRVELRLAVKAGSILEDEDQQGLAHFLEHMAFNGSKNFKKNELVDYLQTIGVKFGPDLNAYTSFDETVYMLLVPTDSAEILNTALQVLEDWAHQITMDHEEIDKERGVVIEEWRIGRGADERMRQQWFPVAYEGSRYAERLPIGKKEVLDTFGYETLKRFYYDWYRPGLMGIVAVGDIDLDEMEAKIKAQFSGIPPDETQGSAPSTACLSSAKTQ